MSDEGEAFAHASPAEAATEPARAAPPQTVPVVLDTEATEMVLRRAFELEQRMPGSDALLRSTAGLTKDSLAEIAEAVDLSPAAIAAALAEMHLEGDTQRSLADRILGPDRIVVQRPSTALDDEMHERAAELLEKGHGLRPRRRHDGVLVASRRKDMVGKLARSVRGAQGEGRLGKLRRVEFVAVDVGETPGAAGMAADVGDRRLNAALGGAAVTVGSSAIIGVGAIIAGPVLLVGLPVAVGAGAMTGRLVHRSTVRDVTEDLEEALDAVASGEAPSGLISRATDRLAREAKARLERTTSRREKRRSKDRP